VLIEGSRDALRFLASILNAVAATETLPSDSSMGPVSAGNFHSADSAKVGLYVSCIATPAITDLS